MDKFQLRLIQLLFADLYAFLYMPGYTKPFKMLLSHRSHAVRYSC